MLEWFAQLPDPDTQQLLCGMMVMTIIMKCLPQNSAKMQRSIGHLHPHCGFVSEADSALQLRDNRGEVGSSAGPWVAEGRGTGVEGTLWFYPSMYYY